MNAKRIMLLVIAGLALSPIVRADGDVPLRNWTVPPYRVSSAGGGMSTMVDVSPGTGFVAMAPCRIVDTRGGGVFAGAYGPPALVGNATRPFDINSAPHCPGIPAGSEAYSLNITIIAAAGSFQNAFLTAWDTARAQPVVSTLNFNPGQLVANAAIVPAGTNGSIDVFASAPGHLLIDINGYFTEEYNPGAAFVAISPTTAPAIDGTSTSTGGDAVAIRGLMASAVSGSSSTAVQGWNNGTGGAGIGVWGNHNGGGYGVYGTSASGYGVYGKSTSGIGVVAGTGGIVPNSAVWAQTTSSGVGSSGVYGSATATGRNYGVFGQTASSAGSSAGVLGVDGSGVSDNYESENPAGVRGESHSFYGVLGISDDHVGVFGKVSPSGAGGALGYGSYGVFSEGAFGGTGAKYFVEPHPEKPGVVVRFVSLEGNESGTYFRGRARFQNGLATIVVPEEFRLVTDSENLSIQVTPIGQMATFAVESIGLDRVVVRGSRNVEFFYTVNGIRKTHKHLFPIGPGREYMPESAHATFPPWLTEGQKEMLISNGTYEADGSVNMETAKRLGWDKEWEKRARPAPQPAE